jgi:hypothetical protein
MSFCSYCQAQSFVLEQKTNDLFTNQTMDFHYQMNCQVKNQLQCHHPLQLEFFFTLLREFFLKLLKVLKCRQILLSFQDRFQHVYFFSQENLLVKPKVEIFQYEYLQSSFVFKKEQTQARQTCA